MALGLWLLATAVQAQEPVYDGLDLDLDPSTISGFAVSVGAQVPLALRGEAFEALHLGAWGVTSAFTAFFADRYAARVRLGVVSLEEHLYDPLDTLADEARLMDLWAQLLWRRSVGPAHFEVGPAVGYARLSRPALSSVQNGFVVAAGVGASVHLGARWLVLVDGSIRWLSFAALDFALPPPPGISDDGAIGRLLGLEIGLAYRWGGTT